MFWKSKNSPKNQVQNDPTPAEDLKIARQALQNGDQGHAVQHLAQALSTEPENQEALYLLDEIIAASPAPLELTKWDNSPLPYPLAAVRAHILYRQGKVDEAVSLMAGIYQAVPGLPYLNWMVEWLQDTSRIGLISTTTFTALLSGLNPKVSAELSKEKASLLEKLLRSLLYYQETCSQEPTFTMMLSILHRKLGKLDEALSLALSAYHSEPAYFTATVLGNAYKQKGLTAEAVKAFRQALAFKPEDLAIRLDIGDTLCEAGKLEEGLEAYQEVLDQAPRHPWAYPSYLYFRSLLLTEPEKQDWASKLEVYARSQPDNQRAAGLVRRNNPYLSSLPEPGDATINLARQITRQDTFPASLEMSLSSLESPSAYRALQLVQEELYGKADIKLEVGAIQRPDPRLPRGEVDYVLWRYQGTVPGANLPPSNNDEVLKAVGEVAGSHYEATIWWGKAGEFARGLSPVYLPDLLGVMLYPPPRQTHFPVWVWLQRVQLAAAFIIARLDNGWEGSVRRKALLSLARGPMDWTVEAAVIALCQVVRNDGTGKEEVELVYRELFENMPAPGGVPYEQALIFCTYYIHPSPQLVALAKKATDRLS